MFSKLSGILLGILLFLALLFPLRQVLATTDTRYMRNSKTTTALYASSYTINTGSLVSGTLADTQSSNNVYLIFTSSNKILDVEFSGSISIMSPTIVWIIELATNETSSIATRRALWNYPSSRWATGTNESLAWYANSIVNVDSTTTWTIYDSTNIWRSTTQWKLRINMSSSTDYNYQLKIDYLTYQPDSYDLFTSNTASYASTSVTESSIMGIKVYLIYPNGTLTKVNSGTMVANVTIPTGSTTTLSATWSCPQKSMTTTAGVMIKIYDGVAWKATFTTEALGDTQLDSSTWTVYYAFYYSGIAEIEYFRFGSATYNSRITNFQHSSPAAKEWHEVAKWLFELRTRQWTEAAKWDFELVTRGTNHTTIVYADGDDGFIRNVTTQAGGWAAGWNNENGTVYDSTLLVSMGMRLTRIGYPVPSLVTDRGYFFFNTSFLDIGDATILSANLSFYLYEKNKNAQQWYNLTVQDGQPDYPNKPLIESDYNRTLYSGNGGSINMSSPSASARFNIPLNDDGISWINITGITKFCLRTSMDIAGSWDETGYADLTVWASEVKPYLPLYVPYLVIVWTGFYWNQASLWNFELLTRQWLEAAKWTLDLYTRGWFEVAKWIFRLLPQFMFPIEWIIMPLFLCCLGLLLLIATFKRRRKQLIQQEPQEYAEID